MAPSRIREMGTDGVTYEQATPASQPGDVFPTGMVVQFAGSVAPTNWALLDGSAVSRTGAYAALFNLIGTTYGAGDGVNTFNLPNGTGKVLVGKNAGTFSALGLTGGEETHVISVAEMPAHGHTVSASGSGSGSTDVQGSHTHSARTQDNYLLDVTGAGTVQSGTAGSFITPKNAGGVTVDAGGAHSHNVSVSVSVVGSAANTGGGGAHNNLQPYLVVNHIIKL